MYASLRIVFFLVAIVVLSPASVSGRESVLVFGEAHFPRSGSSAPVSAQRLVAALRQSGLGARAVDARGLESGWLLEDAASSILVLASGNVFAKGGALC